MAWNRALDFLLGVRLDDREEIVGRMASDGGKWWWHGGGVQQHGDDVRWWIQNGEEGGDKHGAAWAEMERGEAAQTWGAAARIDREDSRTNDEGSGGHLRPDWQWGRWRRHGASVRQCWHGKLGRWPWRIMVASGLVMGGMMRRMAAGRRPTMRKEEASVGEN